MSQHNPTTVHNCGGTILSGPDHDYCDTCEAFQYDNVTTEGFPDGNDLLANRASRDRGDDHSPDQGDYTEDDLRREP